MPGTFAIWSSFTRWSSLGSSERFYEDLQDLLELTPKKDILFILEDWNAKVGSQETPGVTGKFSLEVQNEAGRRLTEFCQEFSMPLVIENTLFQQHKRRLHMDITRWSRHFEIRLIIFVAAKMEKLYTVSKKQDKQLTVAQIMHSLLLKSDLN